MFILPPAIWGLVESPIVTDRPDFTESAVTVPKGKLQIETGFTAEFGAETNYSAPEALIRYGISDRWELRVVPPNRLETRSGAAAWTDSSIGFKYQIGPVGELDVAVIGSLTLPTGEPDVRSDDSVPGVQLCAARELEEGLTLSGMLAGEWPRGEAASYLATVSLGRGLTETSGVFLEVAGFLSKQREADWLLHTGFVLQPDPDRQWDVHLGVRTKELDRLAFVGVGYSIRF